MTTKQQAQALITSAQIYLRRYSAANGALKETKAVLEEYMTTEQIEDIQGNDQGSCARFIYRGVRTLMVDHMPDQLILAAAALGILKGSMSDFDDLEPAVRAQFEEHIADGEGTRYVDVYFPSWGDKKRITKTDQQPAQASPPPAQTPPPAQPPPTPITQANEQPAPAQQEQWACPTHPAREAKESKWGGFFCTAQDGGAYCKQSSQKAS